MIKRIKSNPWPHAIVGYFIVFIATMATWVAFAVRNDMELERSDYYEHEIRYQAQIDRVARTAAIREQVSVTYSPGQKVIALTLPKEHLRATAAGEVHLYRPSDSKLDRRFPLAVSGTGAQYVDVAGLPAGLWKLRVAWTANGADYYVDQAVILGEN